MTPVVMVMTLMLGAVVQTLSPAYPALGQAKAPVLLAVVVYYALNRTSAVMVCAALLAGFLQDALSSIPLGYSSAVFVVAGWLISRYRNLVNTESAVTPLFFGAIAGSSVLLLMTLLLARAGLVYIMPGRLLLKLLGAGFLCMLATFVVFLLLGALERMVGNVRTVNEVGGTIQY